MKKTYEIDVDCANCAALMERTAATVEGVASVTVSFMTLKMTVEFSDGADERAVMKAVRRACKKAEPDCDVFF